MTFLSTLALTLSRGMSSASLSPSDMVLMSSDMRQIFLGTSASTHAGSAAAEPHTHICRSVLRARPADGACSRPIDHDSHTIHAAFAEGSARIGVRTQAATCRVGRLAGWQAGWLAGYPGERGVLLLLLVVLLVKYVRNTSLSELLSDSTSLASPSSRPLTGSILASFCSDMARGEERRRRTGGQLCSDKQTHTHTHEGEQQHARARLTTHATQDDALSPIEQAQRRSAVLVRPSFSLLPSPLSPNPAVCLQLFIRCTRHILEAGARWRHTSAVCHLSVLCPRKVGSPNRGTPPWRHAPYFPTVP